MGLDTVDLIVAIEKHFGVSIPDQQAAMIVTVGDIHQVVWQQLQQTATVGPISREAMEASIDTIVADRAGLPIKTISPEKRIAEDLGMD